MNSVHVAKIPAWTNVKDFELTDVAYELATSYQLVRHRVDLRRE